MQTILHNCCGLDVHKDSVFACIIKTENSTSSTTKKEEIIKEIREFKTFPDDLLMLKKWLVSENCRHVAMESSGVYWYPVYETLEGAFDGEMELVVVNARHMRNVPGKKTDIKDSEWIAKLHRAGLLKGSFIPPKNVRELRELTRYRKFIVQDITKQKNRIEKTMQIAGFKLSTFLSDIFGVSGRNLINVLIKKGYLTTIDIDTKTKRISEEKKAEIKRTLNSKLTNHQRNVLKLQIAHLDSQGAHLKTIEQSIENLLEPFEDAVTRLDTVPGLSTTAATAIIAEVGIDMNKFTTADHLASWAGLSPGNNMSAGKKKVLASATVTPL
jgi:transposase